MDRNKSTRSTGLRRYIAQPDRYAERYGKFTLTARDYEILDLIYRYRHLEARHIRALISGSDQQITRRLQGLFHNKYIGRYVPRHRMRLELDPGPPVVAYGLDLLGARALDARFSAQAHATKPSVRMHNWRKDHTRRTEWFLEHRLMLSHFRSLLELAVRSEPHASILDWSDGHDVRLTVKIPGPPQRRIGLAPDATFTLRDSSGKHYYFLEIDRGTEEHSRLVRKYVAYWWYLHGTRTANRSRRQLRTNVLFLTTGPARLENMINSLRRMSKPNRAAHGGRGVFWFASSRALTLDDPSVVLTPMWRRSNDSGYPVSLLPLPEKRLGHCHRQPA